MADSKAPNKGAIRVAETADIPPGAVPVLNMAEIIIAYALPERSDG